MSEDDARSPQFPVERFPGPVCRYAVEDGNPVVHGTNRAFERQFGDVSGGETVPAVFDSLDIAICDSDAVSDALDTDDRFTVALTRSGGSGSEHYLVETVPPTDGSDGFLVFTRSSEGTNCTGTSELDADHVATVISHELRNPLDVAKARLEAGRELDEDEHLERVAWAHDRMERIIQDVLTLARADDVGLQKVEIDLGTVAETAWETVATNGATLTVEQSLPTAVADEDRVGRLFENLFRNAVEHGSTGTASQTRQDANVTVTVGPLEDGFYVEDDGPGIPEDEQDRVFEPGYSLDEHSTGIGLAIVARIVDLHDWSIELTTGRNGGARFEISGLEPTEKR